MAPQTQVTKKIDQIGHSNQPFKVHFRVPMEVHEDPGGSLSLGIVPQCSKCLEGLDNLYYRKGKNIRFFRDPVGLI